tara:strand:- start:278988 stop:280451 length:1464 start_codon:yes stop_codon:yes gene_type:complete
VVLVAFALAADLPLVHADDPTRDRPNVLFIVADDLNCAIEPYGDPIARTPNLSRLADGGVTFLRTYCQQAVCNPSRSSFLTGLRPNTVGVDDLQAYFRDTAADGDQLVTLPEHFKNHGYFCQDIGKMFHNTGETQDRRSWSIDEVFYRGTHANDTVFGNQPYGAGKPPYKSPVTESLDVPDTVYRDGQIANLAAAAIRDHDSPQPFFLAVGFWRPHLPFVAPKKYWDMYDPDNIAPPDPAEPPSNVPAIAMHASKEIRGYGDRPRDRELTDDEVRHYRHGYYASISFMDAQIGEILDALRHSRHAENTIVIFTSDHGFHIGEHTLWAKTTNFELDARVPLIIADPRRPSTHGARAITPSELIDLYPTMAHMSHIDDDLSERLEGADLTPALADPSAIIKPAAFTQHQHPFYGNRKNWKAWGYSIRTQDWRYTEWRSITDDQVIARELYDHQTDNKETMNVAAEQSHRGIIKRLSERLSETFPVAVKQ